MTYDVSKRYNMGVTRQNREWLQNQTQCAIGSKVDVSMHRGNLEVWWQWCLPESSSFPPKAPIRWAQNSRLFFHPHSWSDQQRPAKWVFKIIRLRSLEKRNVTYSIEELHTQIVMANKLRKWTLKNPNLQRSSCGQKIVNNENSISTREGVLLDLDDVLKWEGIRMFK